jgi:hypothetical protein
VRRGVEPSSPAAEFAVVILGAFGFFIVNSTGAVLLRGSGDGAAGTGAQITESIYNVYAPAAFIGP